MGQFISLNELTKQTINLCSMPVWSQAQLVRFLCFFLLCKVQAYKAGALSVLIWVALWFFLPGLLPLGVCVQTSTPEEDLRSQEGQPIAIDFYFSLGRKQPIPISFENQFSVYTRNQIFVWWSIMCPFLKQKQKQSLSSNIGNNTSHCSALGCSEPSAQHAVPFVDPQLMFVE